MLGRMVIYHPWLKEPALAFSLSTIVSGEVHCAAGTVKDPRIGASEVWRPAKRCVTVIAFQKYNSSEQQVAVISTRERKESKTQCGTLCVGFRRDGSAHLPSFHAHHTCLRDVKRFPVFIGGWKPCSMVIVSRESFRGIAPELRRLGGPKSAT